MKKLVVAGVVGICTAGVIIAVKKRDPDTGYRTLSEKMTECMDKMPEDFPPKVVFESVQATRDNTEQILSLLNKPEVTSSASEESAELSV